ncbi:MAG: DUF29 domain-containing protein [Microcystaceae cyanobacterium]
MDTLKFLTLYDQDYLLWLEDTLKLLRTQNYEKVDWQNLLEEIEDMGKREKRALESNLIILLIYLLKCQYQPEKRSGSWERSILEHRRRIKKALKDSPSLNPYLMTILEESYAEAVKQTKVETQLPLNTFPPKCPYQLRTLLEDNFLL